MFSPEFLTNRRSFFGVFFVFFLISLGSFSFYLDTGKKNMKYIPVDAYICPASLADLFFLTLPDGAKKNEVKMAAPFSFG